MNKLLCCICFIFSVFPQCIFADTIVSGLYTKPVRWSSSGGTYIIQGGATFLNTTLRVDPGVKVRFESGSLFFKNSTSTWSGTEAKPITIYAEDYSKILISADGSHLSLSGVTFTGSNNRGFIEAWKHSSVHLKQVISANFGSGAFVSAFTDSKVDLESIRIQDWQGTGIQVFSSSSAHVTDSDFIHVEKGIYAFDNASVNIDTSVFEANKKAIAIQTSELTVHRSDFKNNQYAIYQDADTGNVLRRLYAESNWFGTSSSPGSQTSTDRVVGNVLLTPWSKTKNRVSVSVCCSNILFFPGLMGSRLYQKTGRYENQLWEPNRNADVKKLFLNVYGKPIESGIYTRDILSKTNIFGGYVLDKSIYTDFEKDMKDLVSKKIIRHFDSVPYDWRLSPDSILQEGIDMSTSSSIFTSYIFDLIINSAKDSKTGKVTLISHSNGGLVIQYLLAYAKQQHIDLPIEKIVYVAMPEHGTPQAITSLLFGHEQTIGGGLILKSSVAKDLGKNMPTAYMLLPTQLYFDQNAPIVLGRQKVSSQEYMKYILATSSSLFNKTLFDKAQAVHRFIRDHKEYSFEQFQIVGVGAPTVSGFVLNGNRPVPTYTNMGDGVVEVYKNRTGIVVQKDISNTSYTHADIMNAPDIIQGIRHIVTGGFYEGYVFTDIKAQTYERFIIEDLEPMVDPIELRFMQPIQNIKVKQNISNTFIQTEGGPISSMSSIRTFDDGVEYIRSPSLGSPISLQISSKNTNPIRIQQVVPQGHISELGFQTLQIKTYDNIPTYTKTVVEFTDKSAIISLPEIGVQDMIQPSRVTDVRDGEVVSLIQMATSSVDLVDILAQIKNARKELASSTVGFYLKTRYLRYIDRILAQWGSTATSSSLPKSYAEVQKQAVLILKERIQRSIKNIDRYTNNSALRSRYGKDRRDYIYILYILDKTVAK